MAQIHLREHSSWLTFVRRFVRRVYVSCSSRIFSIIVTVVIIARIPAEIPDDSSLNLAQSWATFLGVSSALLAAVQYAPQLWHTYTTKLVGALSIPM
jgi:hypothetical protein